MSKKYIIPGALLALVLVAWLAFGSDSSEDSIIYATPETGSFEVTITTTGELRARNSTSIRGPEGMREFRIFNVTIQDIIPEGTLVQRGDYVATLDQSQALTTLQDAELSLEEEEAALEIAQLDSSRTLSDARDNIIDLEFQLEEAQIALEQSKYESPAVQREAKIALDRAERNLAQAERNYELTKKQAEAEIREILADVREERNDVEQIKKIMGNFTIYAPENGMVIYRRNRDGSKVTEGSEINGWDPVVAELPDFSQMESVTYVNEVDIQNVRAGQQVDIGLDAMPDKKLSGVVSSVANIGEQRPNSNSKVFQVIIEVNQSDSTLRPAMTTSNLINISSVDSALYVPLETVHTEDTLNFVYKRDGGSIVRQQVIMGLMNENNVIIHEGVQPDDQLFLSSPDDTTGIRNERLPAEVLEEYRQQQTTEPQQQQRQIGGGLEEMLNQMPAAMRDRMEQMLESGEADTAELLQKMRQGMQQMQRMGGGQGGPPTGGGGPPTGGDNDDGS
ncbi:MAG: efflux RND transporter periplasmic adaptor subunit [Balneolaceae bacterium]|nr:efflux RND transporter periplasmic adaptor subunit [Balneolaceae bacterium]